MKTKRKSKLIIWLILGFLGMASLATHGAELRGGGDQKPIRACCVITAIDSAKRLVTAKETANGRAFQFTVPDRRLLGTLQVGHPVYANYQTKQVSLDGKKTCCTILKISTAAKQPAPGTTPVAPRSSAPLPGTARAVTALPKLSFGTPQNAQTTSDGAQTRRQLYKQARALGVALRASDTRVVAKAQRDVRKYLADLRQVFDLPATA